MPRTKIVVKQLCEILNIVKHINVRFLQFLAKPKDSLWTIFSNPLESILHKNYFREAHAKMRNIIKLILNRAMGKCN